MMDIDKLINYLERKSADTAELQAASAIIQLRSDLQEAKEVITVQHMALEDYGITHDQRAQEIERLREQRDELMAALERIGAWLEIRNLGGLMPLERELIVRAKEKT